MFTMGNCDDAVFNDIAILISGMTMWFATFGEG